MRELLRNMDRMYKLYEDGEQLVLSVVCGGIGMFEAKVVLTDGEKADYEEQGESYLDDLAYDIGKDQSKYADRMIN